MSISIKKGQENFWYVDTQNKFGREYDVHQFYDHALGDVRAAQIGDPIPTHTGPTWIPAHHAPRIAARTQSPFAAQPTMTVPRGTEPAPPGAVSYQSGNPNRWYVSTSPPKYRQSTPASARTATVSTTPNWITPHNSTRLTAKPETPFASRPEHVLRTTLLTSRSRGEPGLSSYTRAPGASSSAVALDASWNSAARSQRSLASPSLSQRSTRSAR
eukprot:TRINITY_DN5260_c0_g1_i1.p1 TRINITY_DN5260_c0_g1~~TRINITY_DN5260_c0_g1_i1.p1  ORF type:complete len:215 (+),score=8.74 TRINITY_DN5260_c0_g1_i1:42-686(+)